MPASKGVAFCQRPLADVFRPNTLQGALVGAVAAPVVGLAVALPAHYPNDFDTIQHLGLIYIGTAIFVVGALVALKGLREPAG